jgi:DNA polymerase-3 subunit epsilon
MKSYVVLDLETTGLDYRTEQITEIGAIKIDDDFNEIDRFHTMVALHDGNELSEFITNLTGITPEDLVGQPSESDALEDLKEFIGDSIVVAQNAPFDLSFLWNGGIQPKQFLCTRSLVRYVEPELSASLKDVTERNGIELNGHHRALNDVKATIEVMKLYLAKIDEDVYDPFNIVIDEPNRPLNFGPRYSAVRKLAYVALDMFELDCIERGEIPAYLRKRIAEVNNRMEAI